MKHLRDSITEAISSRKNRYLPDHPDKDAIVDWLDANGYTEISGELPGSAITHYEVTGEKCYFLGRYWSSDDKTHWIMVYNGKDLYMIRTSPGSENATGMNGSSVTRNASKASSPRSITYKEIQKELEEG